MENCTDGLTKYKRSKSISAYIYTFFYLDRFLKKLAGGQCSSINKGNILLNVTISNVFDVYVLICLIYAYTVFLVCNLSFFSLTEHNNSECVYQMVVAKIQIQRTDTKHLQKSMRSQFQIIVW